MLIGTDSRPIDPTFRTDTLIVVSINKDAGTVSLLSIPRDLYVYIPTYGTARINLAFQAANSVAFTGGGPALLEQTILYNLGIPIQYYALVNFDGFRQVVDTLGGIDVPVNCQVTEYKLKDPTLDERVAANYDLYTQPSWASRTWTAPWRCGMRAPGRSAAISFAAIASARCCAPCSTRA